MTDLVGKITKVLLLLMMAVTVVVAILFYIDISVPEGEATPTGYVSVLLNLVYIFAIFAGICAVGFGLFKFVMKFVESPMDGVKMVIPFVVLIIVGFIAYGNASDSALGMENYLGTDNFDGSKSLKWSGAGLIGMYILAVLAAASILFAEVSKLLK